MHSQSRTRWDGVLQPIKEMPQDYILESLYKMRKRESEQLKAVLALYDHDIKQTDFLPSDLKLKTLVKKRTDNDRNTGEKHE